MSRAPINKDEERRLAALREYGIDSPLSDPDFNNLVELATNVFNVPMAVVSLLEAQRQLIIAGTGVACSETARELSFGNHVILRKRILMVPDARKDARFSDNPLVTGAPHVRFYAGIPLRAPSGHAIGTFSILDHKPRASLSARDAHNLQDFAALMMGRLEMRRLTRARQVSQERFEAAAAISPNTTLCVDEQGVITFWNDAAEKMLEYAREQIVGQPIGNLVPDMYPIQLHHLGTDKATLPKGNSIELEARTLSGALVPIALSVARWQRGQEVGYGLILRDFVERQRYEERLYLQAHRDLLTGLAGRTLLGRTLEQVVRNHHAACVMMIDLDGFKDINDSLGHASGDELLINVARRLQAHTRPGDVVARMGGDEFAVLLPGMTDARLATELAGRIIHDISQVVMVGEQPVSTSASIGLAMYPTHGATAQDLLTSADLALYQAKSEGRNGYRFFTRELREVFQAKHAFQLEFIRAYEQNEFEVFYQPQVRLSDRQVIGAEALLRWRHPYKGLLTPGAFLAALERGPWAERIGDWVVHTACQQAAEWCRDGAAQFRISINLFAAQFRSGMLAQKIHSVLERTGLAPGSLELEITENIILSHDENMLKPLNELYRAGIGIAFDDYGTGYASLSMLKHYPVTRLKIDQSFVRAMNDSPPDAAIVRAILYLGKSFGLDVIAEGVETQEQWDRLRRKGCEQAQGYLFGKPMPAAEFARLLGVEPSP